MATIPGLLDGHVTLEVECLDRLYLNGYIGKLATGTGLVFFMREQLDKPVPSPVVLGQISEQFREAVKALAERDGIPVYQFRHKEKKDDLANEFRRQRPVRDAIVFVGVAQEKAQAFNGRKVNGQFQFDRDKTVYVNHYYFYIDDEEFGPLFIKVCSYAGRREPPESPVRGIRPRSSEIPYSRLSPAHGERYLQSFGRIDTLIHSYGEEWREHFLPGHIALIDGPVRIRIELVVD
jgi:hypothetical protein